jgi:1,4-dihydroxy-2-naphthoate octaprenyltransferase
MRKLFSRLAQGGSFAVRSAPSVSQRFRAFVRLSRPLFLAGGAVGVGLGTAVAAYAGRRPTDWFDCGLALLAVAVLQLMSHYANEYFDRTGDAGASRTPFSGGSGVLVEGALAPRVALAAALASLPLGLAAAALFAVQGKPVAGIITIAIALLAWFYSAPPLRLLATGFGELNTAFVVAVLVPLLGYAAQGATLDARALAVTLPGAAAIFVMMLSVEVPDFDADSASGKRNLVVRWGRAGSLPLGLTALVAVYLGVGLALLAGAPPTFAYFQVLSLPLAFGLAGAFKRAQGSRTGDTALAALGVAFSFIVALDGLAGCLAGTLANPNP